MKPISAIDAIAYAFSRTRAVIAQPFRFGFFLKLVILGAFSAANLISLGILFPMQASSIFFRFMMARQGATTPSPFQNTGGLGPVFYAFLAIGTVIGLLISVALFYLFTRLRFVIFDAVLLGERKFGRPWSRYSRAANRYYGLSILISLAGMLTASAVAAPLILISLRMLKAGGSSAGTPGPAFGYLLISMLIEYALIFVATLVDGWTHDFLLPPMAIEDASIERSFARFIALWREDFAAVFVYTLLRFVLRIGLSLALIFITVVPVAIFGAVLVGLGFLLYHLLWSAGLGGQVVFGVYAVVAGLSTFVLYLAAIFTASGIVAVFTQAYALIFYAARYPQLGNILNPPLPALEIAPDTVPQPASPPETPPPFLPEPPALW